MYSVQNTRSGESPADGPQTMTREELREFIIRQHLLRQQELVRIRWQSTTRNSPS